MGLFKKLGKKLRGFFKRIGKGIKKGFKKFGKFMGKIGILGQIAMMFILPGIGSLMLKGLGAMTGLTATAGSAAAAAGGLGTASGFVTAAAGSSSVIAKGVAWTLKTAQRFANSPLLKPFKTVTDAVSSFVDNTTKFVGNKVGLGNIKPGSDFANYFKDAPAEFFGRGENSVLGRVGKSVTDNIKMFTDDLTAGNIFMSGDKELSLTKAYDTGLAEKVKADNLLNEGQASNVDVIDGNRVDEMFALNTPAGTLDPQLQNLADARANNLNTSNYAKVDFTESVDTIDVISKELPVTAPKRGFFEKVGDRISDIPEDTLAYAGTIPERVGQSLLDAPARTLSNMAVQSVMGGGGRGGPYWGSTAGPTYNPGRDRAEQYAYSSAMASAGATSDMFSSDYDFFTATQADQYGDAEGGTWGNYMGRQRVA